MFMRSSLVLACAATAAQAFSPAAMGLRPSAVSASVKAPLSAVSLRSNTRAMVGLKMQEGDPNAKPDVMFDSNSGWVPEHHKTNNPATTGNVDTPDYFEGDSNADATGFSSGAAATGGDGGNKLGEMLSAANTEVRTVERQSYGEVEFKHPKQAWKIDGSYESGDKTYDLTYSVADACAKTEICLEPSSMTFEDYLAGFTADSDPGWTVSPSSGTMSRRGGEDTYLNVKYTGAALDGEKFCTFVVMLPGDNFQWTFKLRVNFPK